MRIPRNDTRMHIKVEKFIIFILNWWPPYALFKYTVICKWHTYATEDKQKKISKLRDETIPHRIEIKYLNSWLTLEMTICIHMYRKMGDWKQSGKLILKACVIFTWSLRWVHFNLLTHPSNKTAKSAINFW